MPRNGVSRDRRDRSKEYQRRKEVRATSPKKRRVPKDCPVCGNPLGYYQKTCSDECRDVLNRNNNNKYRREMRDKSPWRLMILRSLQRHRKKGCDVSPDLLDGLWKHAQEIDTCAYCGLPLDWSITDCYAPFYPTIDRVYNSKKMTHVWGGPEDKGEGAVAIVHHRCNSMKSGMSLSELANICEGIAKWNKL